MQKRKFGLLTLLVCVLPLSTVNATDGIRIAHSEPLQQMSLRSTADEDFQKPSTTLVSRLQFDALGKRFDVNLMPNHTLLPAALRARIAGTMSVYRGELNDVPDSWARIVVVDGLPQGVLWDGQNMLAIEVVNDKTSDVSHSIIYRLADLYVEPGTLSCSHVSTAKTGADLFNTVVSRTNVARAAAPGASSQIDVATIGDFEFTNSKGASSDAEIVTRMNIVDGIFSEQLGVQINVARIDTYDSASDPFTDESNSSALIDELADYRNATPAQNSNGLTHLFTGRDLEGTTVGIAYGGALCSRRFGAGLTQATHSVTLDSLIAAHEIGHNFGAPHDGTTGACESTAQDFLMAPRLNGSDEFSACSVSQMQDDVNRASCITALANVDVSVVADGQPSPVLLGDTGSVSFDVTSAGTDTADNANLEISIPAAVSFDSVATTAGTCSSGASAASCAIGSIASGSGATVTVSFSTTAVGDAAFVATASATDDANGNNNQATSTIAVDAAVDLLVSSVAATVTVNDETSLGLSVRNLATIAASDVVVTISPDAGIRIDDASWSEGTCSVSAGVATCNAASAAAQSTNVIDVRMTGVAEGSHSYTISATAAEVDRDTANNDASGQVSVNAAGGGDDGGGGVVGWLALFLFALIAIARQDSRYLRVFSSSRTSRKDGRSFKNTAIPSPMRR